MVESIDAHTHFHPRSLVAFLSARTEPPRIAVEDGRRWLYFGPGVPAPYQDSMDHLDLKIAQMDAAGTSSAILSVASGRLDAFTAAEAIALSRGVNDELVDLVTSRADRFAALALLPLQAPESAAKELERCVSSGLKGALVESNVAGRPLDDPIFYPIFEAAAHLDVPLFLHPNHPMISGPVEEYDLVPVVGFLIDSTIVALRLVLSGVYERHPNLKMFLAHAGSLLFPLIGRVDKFYDVGRLATGSSLRDAPPSAYLRRLYTDTVCGSGPVLKTAIALVGEDHVVSGTDAPYFDAAWNEQTLTKADLPGGVEEKIRTENARRLFGLG